MAPQESSVLNVACDTDFTSAFISGLSTLRTDGTFCDFTIRVDDVTIPCHRLVLAAVCPYFRALFSSGLAEATKGEVALDNLDPDAVKNIVDYMYTGDTDIQWCAMKDVIEACEFLQLEHLKGHCEDFVLQNLTEDDCLEWYFFSCSFSKKIKERALDLIKWNFVYVSKSEDFKKIAMCELKSLLLANPATVMYHIGAVIEWIKYDTENRQEHSEDLFLAVGYLDLCPDGYIKYVCVTYCELITANTQKTFKEPLVQPVRRGEEREHLIVVPNCLPIDEEKPVCWKLAASETHFEPLCDMPEGVEFFPTEHRDRSVCTLPNGFAILEEDTTPRTEGSAWNIHIYNMQTLKWNLEKIYFDGYPAVSDYDSVIYIDHVIFVHLSSDCETIAIDLESLRAVVLPFIPTAIVGPFTIAKRVGHRIYLIVETLVDGGQETDYKLETYFFDVYENEWTQKASMPEKINLNEADGVVCGGKIYVVGGHPNVCFGYDVSLDTWTKYSQPSLMHQSGPFACKFKGMIYIAGCITGAEKIQIEKYEPENDAWETSNLPLPSKMSQFGMIAVTSGKWLLNH